MRSLYGLSYMVAFSMVDEPQVSIQLSRIVTRGCSVLFVDTRIQSVATGWRIVCRRIAASNMVLFHDKP